MKYCPHSVLVNLINCLDWSLIGKPLLTEWNVFTEKYRIEVFWTDRVRLRYFSVNTEKASVIKGLLVLYGIILPETRLFFLLVLAVIMSFWVCYVSWCSNIPFWLTQTNRDYYTIIFIVQRLFKLLEFTQSIT